MRATIKNEEFIEPTEESEPTQHNNKNEALEQFSSHMNLDIGCETEFD